jgi:hypothetical protein
MKENGRVLFIVFFIKMDVTMKEIGRLRNHKESKGTYYDNDGTIYYKEVDMMGNANAIERKNHLEVQCW